MTEKVNKKRESLILPLFITFLKIGAFTFGGGYAMIPIIQKEIAEKKKWLTDEDILDIIAVSESTPGPIAINSATFVGYRVAGFWGAFFSTFAVVLPSFLIISILSLILKEFAEVRSVQNAFFGIRAGVLALLLRALFLMYKKCPKNIASYFIMAISFLFASVFKLNIFFVILICAILGLCFSLYAKRRATK
ncbi:MAG: chromate transporter [Clostridia bacterium]|nr:chromate transporter [Clostridia bacterium]